MKKNLILFILIPIFCFAKFHKGILTFNDDKILSGFIEIPDDSENSKIKFKSDIKGKTEKFPLEVIKSFIINEDKDQSLKFVITTLAYFNAFKKDNSFRKHNKLACVRVLREGKVNFYSAWFMTTGAGSGAVGGATITGSFTSGELFINREGNDYSLEFYEGNPSGINVTVNSFKYLKEMINKHFGKECPSLINLIEKDDIKKNGFNRIFELYEENCNSI